MEKQSPLPISVSRDDDEAEVVIKVTENLSKALATPGIEDVGSGESSGPSIYKIPHFMREIQPKAFEPQLVSFGPYHHGKQHLLPMELEKLKVFHRFKTQFGLDVQSIVKRVSNILEDVRRSYDGLEDNWKRDAGKLLQLMIVDGCFMLQFFNDDCSKSASNMSGDIKRDMLLLENQLPMMLLDELYSMANEKQPLVFESTMESLVRNSMCINKSSGLTRKCLHVLDMYRMVLLIPPIDNKDRSGSGSGKKDDDKSSPECQIIRPATQLREAGIKFKKSDSESLKDVSFDPKRGVLRLPHMVVDDDTEPAFLNVMAFEKLHIGAGSEVTSFIILMNNLIDVDKDVGLLASNEILANALGNDQGAAELFNLLGKGAALDLDSHITEVHRLMNVHCKKSWNEWCASLKHDYFQNPWAIISLIAASLGFTILILQAVYQICDYY